MRAFLNIIYPPLCQACGTRLSENAGLCTKCIQAIQKNEYGIAACDYEGALKEALHKFKYSGVLSPLKALSPILLEFIEKNIDTENIDAIIPIPLYHAKLRERGFNQSRLLSIPISKRYNIPISGNILIKTKPTSPQSNLNRKERLKNLKGAFTVKKNALLTGKRVLLVDDVYTTGATIDEASRVLMKAGVSNIKIVTLAKGLLGK